MIVAQSKASVNKLDIAISEMDRRIHISHKKVNHQPNTVLSHNRPSFRSIPLAGGGQPPHRKQRDIFGSIPLRRKNHKNKQTRARESEDMAAQNQKLCKIVQFERDDTPLDISKDRY